MNLKNKTIYAGVGTMLCLAANSAFAGGSMLKCELKAPSEAKLGENVSLNFKLTNTTDKPLKVLKWNTPLEEGWFGSSFNVTRNGDWVNYTGAMVKRFRPSDNDYVAIPPGKSVENSVDLAVGYDLKKAGSYKFVFNGRVQDVQAIAKGEEVSASRKMYKLACDEFSIALK